MSDAPPSLPASIEEDRLLRLILDSIGVGVAVADAQGRILLANAAAMKMAESGKMEGGPQDWPRQYGMFLPDAVTPFPAATLPLARALKGESSDEVEMFARNPRVPKGAFLRVTGRPLRDAKGEIVGGVLVLRDVTESRTIEKAKDELLAIASHELRNPASAIQFSLYALADAGALTAQQKELMDKAVKNCDRLLSTINHYLDVERMTLGQESFNWESVDIAALAGDTISALSPWAEKQGVRLELGTMTPVQVRADRDRVVQVLSNLVTNGVKFSPKGAAVTIGVARVAERARVSVQDRGAGIPEEFRARIFRRFARSQEADKQKVEGTGLGLHIAKTIVEQHGGIIGFDTETGKGTTFYFEIPCG